MILIKFFTSQLSVHWPARAHNSHSPCLLFKVLHIWASGPKHMTTLCDWISQRLSYLHSQTCLEKLHVPEIHPCIWVLNRFRCTGFKKTWGESCHIQCCWCNSMCASSMEEKEGEWGMGKQDPNNPPIRNHLWLSKRFSFIEGKSRQLQWCSSILTSFCLKYMLFSQTLFSISYLKLN